MKTKRMFQDADRYLFDFRLCTYAEGWAQVDSRQDAAYYGAWTNPFLLRLVTYAEGDVTITQAEDPTEYCHLLRDHAQWNKDNDYWLGIDPGCTCADAKEDAPTNLQTRFEVLGLSDLLR